MRVVDETGAHIGIIQTADALKMAYDRGYDLVEVSPDAAPPVCKIMSYSKFKYEQHKKEQKEKKQHHQGKIKELRLRPITEEHDIQVRLKKAKEFLGKGNKVIFSLFFKGRENTHRDIGFRLMERIKKDLMEYSKIEKPISPEGPRLTLVLGPK